MQKLFKSNQKAAELTATGRKWKRKDERAAFWTRYLTSNSGAAKEGATSGPNDGTT